MYRTIHTRDKPKDAPPHFSKPLAQKFKTLPSPLLMLAVVMISVISARGTHSALHFLPSYLSYILRKSKPSIAIRATIISANSGGRFTDFSQRDHPALNTSARSS
jgi:hypothetical protein